MADNKDKKVLKSSIEREQSQTRLTLPSVRRLKVQRTLMFPI